MPPIKTRIVLHFPGFEPLDAAMHRERFMRAAKQSAAIWNFEVETDSLHSGGAFSVRASGPNWNCDTQYHVLDLADHIKALLSRPLWVVIPTGFAAFAKTVAFGGTFRYLINAWRFGLFSIFPFLLMATGIAACITLGLAPKLVGLSAWHLTWSLPASLFAFLRFFIPQSNRLYTLLLFSDWKCAVEFATLKNKTLNDRLSQMVEAARLALSKQADEYVIISHSIGGNSAAHVIGQLAQQEPELFEGKNIVFCTVGSGLLQGALLSPATLLRERVKAIAENPNIFWFDVQCLTDISNFYKTKIAALCGYRGTRQPTISFIRVKTMLLKERYARIKKDLLRVHRQYVLGNDVKANYDYALMCAGPLRAFTFSQLPIGALPPIDGNGAINARHTIS